MKVALIIIILIVEHIYLSIFVKLSKYSSTVSHDHMLVSCGDTIPLLIFRIRCLPFGLEM